MMKQQCPLCDGQNECNVADAINCWCMTVSIPQGLLDLVPKEQQRCICTNCIENYIKKSAFAPVQLRQALEEGS